MTNTEAWAWLARAVAAIIADKSQIRDGAIDMGPLQDHGTYPRRTLSSAKSLKSQFEPLGKKP
jgi:hypothetical protein